MSDDLIERLQRDIDRCVFLGDQFVSVDHVLLMDAQDEIEQLRGLLQSLALHIGRYEWTQLTTPQRALLSSVSGYADPLEAPDE
jgi:hypothetical protein